jgi:putative two-component system response regulator
VTGILVIDDDAVGREVIREMLEAAGYEVVCAATASEALELFGDERIRLVVSDIVMPDLSGLELLEAMRLHRPALPIVLVTGANTRDNLTEALMRGADGLVGKPFTQIQLQEAVGKALERADRSEREIRDRLLAPTLTSALANAIEAREEGMRGHCERLTVLAMHLGLAVGLGEEEIETLRLGALLHDIGKIGIPDSVLLKADVLNDEETALMRTHTVIGDNLLEPIDLLAAVRPIVRHHHERWDGLGYPDGIAGEEIPLGARIMAVSDAVEAMSAHRVYREPLSEPQIVRELERGRGTQWDPTIVDLVLRMIETDAISFSADGVRVSQVLPHRAAAAVLRFPGPRSRAELLGRASEGAR